MAAPMSDISGYRSDGGGLGQDQGLTKQLRGILTAKLPLLSAPGTVLENTLYYDINSSSVTAVEEQATFAKDRIALNNTQMGATPTAYIPSVLFAGTVFWIAELPDVNYNALIDGRVANAADNIVIPHGWGFSALDNIICYMGASSIAQIQISAKTNLLVNCATCETRSKRDLMITGAGQYLNNRDKMSLMAPPPKLAGTPATSIWRIQRYGDYYNPVADTGLGTADWIKQAVVPLRLPWSSMAVLDKRLSLDCKLSTQPIQITLQTKERDEFMYLGAAIKPNFPSSYKSSTLQLWQEELSDKSLSVRNELLAMPEFNVGYPFQYAQSIPFTVDTKGNDAAANTTFDFLLNITSIINSDLTTFLFSVNWDGRSNPANGQLCPNFGEELLNIELLLNGQRFFFFDQNSYPFVTLAKQIDDPRFSLWMPSANSTNEVGNPSAFRTDSNIYEFNNSRLRSICSEHHLQNTARFTNQQFQLKFRINRENYFLGEYPVVQKTDGYTVNMTYLYNAVYLVGGDGGTTKLITN